MKKLWSGIVVFAIAVLVAGSTSAGEPLKVGDKAPEVAISLPSSAGEKPGDVMIRLSDFIGKKNIVLAFYVADWTGG